MSTSVQPVNLFSLFHWLSPWRSKTTLWIFAASQSDCPVVSVGAVGTSEGAAVFTVSVPVHPANATHAIGFFLVFIAAAGFLSAFLMNDTVAIIGTLFAVSLSKKMNIPGEILLITLAFSVTTGSVLSPVGNPQNLLIALSEGFAGSAAFGGLSASANPFVVFGAYLIVPTLISLLLIYPILKLFYPDFSAVRKSLTATEKTNPDSTETSEVAVVADGRLAKIAEISLGVLVLMILLKGAASFFNNSSLIQLPMIAVAAALPVILFSKRRFEIVKGIDWGTIIFFAAMFVLMQSAWDSGFIQGILNLPLRSHGVWTRSRAIS